MADLAGGPERLDEVLSEWGTSAAFDELAQTHSTDWDTADKLALALIAKT